MSKFRLPVKKYLILSSLAVVIIVLIVLKTSGVIDLRSEDEKRAERGAALAHIYCTSCHQYPEPSFLDKDTWVKSVLPAMAVRLNLEDFHGNYGMTIASAISVPDFKDIVAFYKGAAPQKLVIPPDSASVDWAIFSLQKPLDVSYEPGNGANTVMVKYNPADKKLYAGDMRNNLFTWDVNLKPTLVAKMPSPPVHANFYQATGRNFANITCIGILTPNDLLKGSLLTIGLGNSSETKPRIIADSLARPVQTVSADFNKDGLTDYVTCGFGNNKGNLYLFMQQPGHSFKKSVLRAMPGSESLVTGDFNNGGYTDLMCLFAQADVGIWMFINDRKGGFITKNILQ